MSELARHHRVRRADTAELTPADLGEIRSLMDAAFGTDEDERFGDDDWEHAMGGSHFIVDVGGRIVCHAAVVERELRVDEVQLRTGYVEAVATAPDHQGRGIGSDVMAAVNGWIRETYQLGALGTGRHAFYERLGWETWRGPSFVRTAEGDVRTPVEDGYILVLRTPASPSLDLSGRISCDWRLGDVW